VTESEGGTADFLTLLGRDQDWHFDAACSDSTVDFYAEMGSSKRKPGADIVEGRARRVCARCPVRRRCAEAALGYEVGRRHPISGRWERALPFGVWGGVTPAERHDRKVRHEPDCGDRDCNGCRPLANVLDDLDAIHRREVARWLTPSEAVA
jgi:hypothetical protein